MSIKALFSHKDIFTRGGFPIFNYLKFFLKKVVRTFIKTGRGGGQRPFINFIKKQTFWKRMWSLSCWMASPIDSATTGTFQLQQYLLCPISPLSAQIGGSNFHDLTQITQRRVCFNPKRTEKPKAHGFSVRFGLKHTLREVVVVLIANITLRRGVI